MRQLFLSIAILLCSSSLTASWQIGVDAMCIDSSFAGALRLDAEASYCWDELRLTVPIRYSRSFEHELDFIEAEIAVSVYPIDGCGFFLGASMVRMGFFWGLEAPLERFILFSEVIAGWTFSWPWFFLEPRIAVLDLYRAEEGRLEDLGEAVPQYSKLRFSLIVGVEIP